MSKNTLNEQRVVISNAIADFWNGYNKLYTFCGDAVVPHDADPDHLLRQLEDVLHAMRSGDRKKGAYVAGMTGVSEWMTMTEEERASRRRAAAATKLRWAREGTEEVLRKMNSNREELVVALTTPKNTDW